MTLPRLTKRTLVIVLSLAAVQLAFVLIYRSIGRERARSHVTAFVGEPALSQRALDGRLVDENGSNHRLSELRGKPVLVHFWATWCPPCKAELPALLELGRELHSQGRLRVVAVAVDKDWQSIRKFFKGTVPPEVLRDDGDAAQNFEVSALPDTYLLGKDGTALVRFAGARDWSLEEARERLLKETLP